MVRSPRASSRISIVDNDTIVADPAAPVRDAVVDEKDGFAYVSVLLGGTGGQASNSTVTVDYATANGTATCRLRLHDQWRARSPSPPARRRRRSSIPITDDGEREPTESFALNLSNPTLATIADSSGIAAIGASDGTAASQPRILAPADAIVGEADGFVDLVVSLSAAGPEPVTVDYADCNSTAGAGNACNGDFTRRRRRAHLRARRDDQGRPRPDPRLHRRRSCSMRSPSGSDTPVNGAIARASGRISIVDNDNVVATPRLFVRDAVVDEKDGIALGLGAPRRPRRPVLEQHGHGRLRDRERHRDRRLRLHRRRAGTLTFAPGETAKTVRRPDRRRRDDRGHGELRAQPEQPDQGDDLRRHRDGPDRRQRRHRDARSRASSRRPTSSSARATASSTWWSGSRSRGRTRSRSTTRTSTARPAPATAATATYVAVNGTLTFAPGETTKVVRVQILDCPDVEGFEAFTFGLSTPANGAIAPRERSDLDRRQRHGRRDAEAARARRRRRREGRLRARLRCCSAAPAAQSSNSTVTVDYATANGSATAGVDYTAGRRHAQLRARRDREDGRRPDHRRRRRRRRRRASSST